MSLVAGGNEPSAGTWSSRSVGTNRGAVADIRNDPVKRLERLGEGHIQARRPVHQRRCHARFADDTRHKIDVMTRVTSRIVLILRQQNANTCPGLLISAA